MSVCAAPGLQKNAIFERVQRYTENSQLLNDRFNKIEVGNEITKVYDVNEDLFGYVVTVNFDDNVGYVLVGASDEMPIIEASGAAFFNNQEQVEGELEIVKNSDAKIIFAGPLSYILKYKTENAIKYHDINNNKNINKDQFESFKNLVMDKCNISELKSAKDAYSVQAYAYDTLSYDVPIVNQLEFYPSTRQDTGCGPAAGAILAWYVGENKSTYSSLIDGYSSAQELGEGDMFDYMGAGVYGVLPSAFKSGFHDFALYKGLSMYLTETATSAGSSTIWSTLKSCISTKNVPTAMFLGTAKSGSSYPEPEMPTLHWITITGWEEDGTDRYVFLESWGDFYTENYDALWAWRNSICLEYINTTVY